jgi:hypothetical protein
MRSDPEFLDTIKMTRVLVEKNKGDERKWLKKEKPVIQLSIREELLSTADSSKRATLALIDMGR